MKRALLLVVSALIPVVCAAGAAHATKIEIPLSQLNGSYVTTCYHCSVSREMTFTFDRLPVTVYGVSLRLKGLAVPGDVACDPWAMDAPWNIEFVATMVDSVTGGAWSIDRVIGDRGCCNRSPFEFDVEVLFQSQHGASWAFLHAGRGTITLKGKPDSGVPETLNCVYYSHPAGTVYQAVLIVDADYQIGVDRPTWGSIKSLFSR
jgi:hypothetical protein